MKNPILIIVEGEADKRFITQYIDYAFNVQLSKDDIIVAGGWQNIKSPSLAQPIINKMQQCRDNDGTNIVIFDADNCPTQRCEEIFSWGKTNDLEFELFLIPNNALSGALEHLLENVINPNNKPILDCWQRYEEELKNIKIVGREAPLTIPAKKSKIYGYLEALLGNSNSEKELIKERNRDYKNTNHWDLDAEFLIPLKEFLHKFFDEELSS